MTLTSHTPHRGTVPSRRRPVAAGAIAAALALAAGCSGSTGRDIQHARAQPRAPRPLDARRDPTGLEPASAARNAFGLATHEEFHPYVQHSKTRPWSSLEEAEKGGGDDRETMYPLKANPRIQRAMVYNSLLAAYKEPGKRTAHLAEAAYWQKTWARENPDEAKAVRPLELLEGTAKYFEVSAVAMAEAGSHDRQKIRHYLEKALRPMKVASKGVEPYAIGTAALLNADAMHLNVKQALTTINTTPLDQVLRGVNPTASAKAPTGVSDGIEESVKKTNEKLSESIDPFVKAISDDSTPLLLIPIDSASESFGGDGFYTTEEVPITIIPGFRLRFDKLTSGTLAINKETTGIIDLDDKSYFTVPLSLDGKQTRLKGNRLTLDTPQISGEITVKTRTDDGKHSYVAQ